jgi:hypothetical protein
VGRQPNRLLIALTVTDATFPTALQTQGNYGGQSWYQNVVVSCLTPNARPAIAIDVAQPHGNVWSVEVAEVDNSEGKDAWGPGVHLFSVWLQVPSFSAHNSGAIATAVIDDSVRRFKGSDLISPNWGPWFASMAGLAAGGT